MEQSAAALLLALIVKIVAAQDAPVQMAQIVNLGAECRLSGMTISVDFDSPYNGIIYSKGAFYSSGCVYVRAGQDRRRFVFEVPMTDCGTVADIDQATGHKYFENTLIFQMDPILQEMWDTAKRVRCEWQTRFEETIVFQPFQVGMLQSETVVFSGDSATTSFAVQRGRGPFAPLATLDSLIAIGDTITLVVYVNTEDPSFDVSILDCYATDSQERSVLQLTDENGCVLRQKLISAWQTTRDTRNSGAAVIAYAMVNAFKFPDDMEVNLRCNVAICKDGCPERCTAGRSKRSAETEIVVEERRIDLGGRILVGSPDQLARHSNSTQVISGGASQIVDQSSLCFNAIAFFMTSMLIFLLLFTTSLIATTLFLRQPRLLLAPAPASSKA